MKILYLFSLLPLGNVTCLAFGEGVREFIADVQTKYYLQVKLTSEISARVFVCDIIKFLIKSADYNLVRSNTSQLLGN